MYKANNSKRSGTYPDKRKSRHIGLIISVVIIAVLAYLVLVYGSLPYSLLTAKQLNASTLQSIMLSRINSAKTLNLSYNGSIAINGSDPYVQFSYNKNSSSTYLALYILYSNGYNEVTARLANISAPGLVCTTYHEPVYNGQPYALPSCVYRKPYVPMLELADEIANFSTIGNVSTNSYGLQIYKGQLCYSMNGTATVMVNGSIADSLGFIPATVYFNTCISAQYNLPLNLNGYAKMSSGQVVNFHFNETKFNETGSLYLGEV